MAGKHYMIIKMPYGDMNIHNEDLAKRFVNNPCLYCASSDSIDKCTDSRRERCKEKVSLISIAFGIKNERNKQ